MLPKDSSGYCTVTGLAGTAAERASRRCGPAPCAMRTAERYASRLLLLAAISTVTVPALAVAQGSSDSTAPRSTSVAVEPRIAVGPGLESRRPELQDARYAVSAMQLTPAQEQALALLRARFAPVIKAYIARLNALGEQRPAGTTASVGVIADTVAATDDSLRKVLVAEHAAADSVVTPAQRQRYMDALRQTHAGSSGSSGSSVKPASVSPSQRSIGSTSAAGKISSNPDTPVPLP